MQHLENQAAMLWQIRLPVRTGQPLIARMVSNFPIRRSLIPQTHSNPCESALATRGMASAKVSSDARESGATVKQQTNETKHYETQY